MKILEELAPQECRTVIGIDASTRAIGISVVRDGDIVALLKLNVDKGDIIERLAKIRRWIRGVFKVYNPSLIMVESPIMIQNPLTTKHISYAVGIIFGEALDAGVMCTDVSPTTWKSWMGYKKLTKKWKQEIYLQHETTREAEKEINRLKKSQIQDMLKLKYPHYATQFGDDDMADAAGISLYAWHEYGRIK